MAVTAVMAAAAVTVGIAAAEDVITAAGATAAAVGAGAGAVAAVVGACASEVWPFVGDRHPLPDQSDNYRSLAMQKQPPRPMPSPTMMINATNTRSHTAVGRRFADLVVMLPAVRRTHNGQEQDQSVCGDYRQQHGER